MKSLLETIREFEDNNKDYRIIDTEFDNNIRWMKKWDIKADADVIEIKETPTGLKDIVISREDYDKIIK